MSPSIQEGKEGPEEEAGPRARGWAAEKGQAWPLASRRGGAGPHAASAPKSRSAACARLGQHQVWAAGGSGSQALCYCAFPFLTS